MAIPVLFDLFGQVAVGTGSTRGIGKSIAEELGKAGAKVVISSRRDDACEDTRAEPRQKGRTVRAQPCTGGRKGEGGEVLVGGEQEERGAPLSR